MSYRHAVLAVGLSALAACDGSFLHDVDTRRDATDRGCPAPNDGAHDVAAVALSNGTLTVTWTSKATNADGFLIERQSSREPTWGEIGTVTTLAFNDTRVNHDEEYGYRVSALRSAGTSVCATPASEPIAVRTSPNPGGSFTAHGTAAGQITLAWTDVNTFEAGYRIARGVSGAALTPLQSLGPNVAQFVDNTVTPGSIYSYSLVAFNDGGDSTASIVLQRAVTPPTLAWTTPPVLGLQCTFEAGGSASYDSGATFASASGSVGAITIGGTASGPSGPILPTTSGSVSTSWTVDDSAGGESTLSRTLSFVKTSTPRARQRVADSGELAGEGVQALFPACATCAATPPTSLAAGDTFTCQVLANGHVSCWGGNDTAQLGNGKALSARAAIRPCAFDGAGQCTGAPRQLNQVSAGTDSACGVMNDGHAICWGRGAELELGGPLITDAVAPVTVCATVGATDCTTSLANVTQVSVGVHAACAIANGEVWCWGTDGADGSTHVPAPVCANSSGCPHFTADQVEVGNAVTCARRGDKLWCWGDNSSGTFGTDTTATSVIPIPVCKSGTGGTCSALTGVADFAVGDHTACARLNDGTHTDTLYCWGDNGNGQLGTGSANGAETVPAPVCLDNGSGGCASDLPAVGDFDVGADHACARLTTGEVYCWGDNFYNQLGSYSTSSFGAAIPVCASGTGAACPNLTGVTEISVGDEHSCARRNDGHVVCWGDVSARGNPEVPSVAGAALIVCTGGSGANCDTLGNLTQITAGPTYACGIAGGELWCWGGNESGALGVAKGPYSDFASEVLVGIGADARPLDQVRMVASGQEASCALRTDGTVWCWGIDSSGVLAAGTGLAGARGYAAPICASGSGSTCVALSGVVQITVGVLHACAVTSAGELWCWGGDDCGEVGRGVALTCDDTAQTVSVPQRVCADAACSPLGNIVEAAAGWGVTCALKRTGEVLCFGDNRLGQVGAGSAGNSARYPVPICDATSGTCNVLHDLIAVRAGYAHSCAIRKDGGVVCWGSDDCGQLGNPLSASCTAGLKRTDARPVCTDTGVGCTLAADVIEVAVGYAHTCMVTGDGAVSCWGANDLGQAGINFFDNSTDAEPTAPVLQCTGECNSAGCTSPLTGVVSLTVGGSHSCVTREDGIAYCWGANARDQAGSDLDANSITCSAHESCASGHQPSCVPNDSGNVRLCDALSVVVP